MAKRQNTLYPALALCTFCPLASLSPDDSIAQHSFGMIVGGINALLVKEYKQGLNLLAQAACHSSSVVFLVAGKPDQPAEPCINCVPFSLCWRLFRHVAQPLKFTRAPDAEPGDVGVLSFSQSFGPADQMCQAGLSLGGPFLINAIVVADQDAVPFFNQRFEGLL